MWRKDTKSHYFLFLEELLYNSGMKKWIYRILFVVCLGVFGYSAFQLWTIYQQQHQVTAETDTYKKMAEKEKTLDPDWEALKAENEQIVGWLYVPNCHASFPMVQGTDNSYYLYHTASGAENPMGAIFVDANATPGFADDNTIIYGHSVEGGGMVTDLKFFEDPTFFEDNKYFYILTPDVNYRCDIVSFVKTVDGSVFYTTKFGDFREDTLARMKAEADRPDNHSYYREQNLTEQDRLVSISTCNLDYGFESDQRYVLTGVLRPTDEKIKIVDE